MLVTRKTFFAIMIKIFYTKKYTCTYSCKWKLTIRTLRQYFLGESGQLFSQPSHIWTSTNKTIFSFRRSKSATKMRYNPSAVNYFTKPNAPGQHTYADSQHTQNRGIACCLINCETTCTNIRLHLLQQHWPNVLKSVKIWQIVKTAIKQQQQKHLGHYCKLKDFSLFIIVLFWTIDTWHKIESNYRTKWDKTVVLKKTKNYRFTAVFFFKIRKFFVKF